MQEFLQLKNIHASIDAVISDASGQLLDSTISANAEKIASVMSAIFENMKAFITGFQPEKTDKIVLLTARNSVIIKQYDEATVAFLSPAGVFAKLSSHMAQIEKLF